MAAVDRRMLKDLAYEFTNGLKTTVASGFRSGSILTQMHFCLHKSGDRLPAHCGGKMSGHYNGSSTCTYLRSVQRRKLSSATTLEEVLKPTRFQHPLKPAAKKSQYALWQVFFSVVTYAKHMQVFYTRCLGPSSQFLYHKKLPACVKVKYRFWHASTAHFALRGEPAYPNQRALKGRIMLRSVYWLLYNWRIDTHKRTDGRQRPTPLKPAPNYGH